MSWILISSKTYWQPANFTIGSSVVRLVQFEVNELVFGRMCLLSQRNRTVSAGHLSIYLIEKSSERRVCVCRIRYKLFYIYIFSSKGLIKGLHPVTDKVFTPFKVTVCHQFGCREVCKAWLRLKTSFRRVAITCNKHICFLPASMYMWCGSCWENKTVTV